jgi:cell division protein FtsW (lipid II flippase)
MFGINWKRLRRALKQADDVARETVKTHFDGDAETSIRRNTMNKLDKCLFVVGIALTLLSSMAIGYMMVFSWSDWRSVTLESNFFLLLAMMAIWFVCGLIFIELARNSKVCLTKPETLRKK